MIASPEEIQIYLMELATPGWAPIKDGLGDHRKGWFFGEDTYSLSSYTAAG